MFKLKNEGLWKIPYFLLNLLLILDQFINTLMLGDPSETISSRAGRVFPNTWWSNFIDAIMFWQKDHCHKAITPDEGQRDILFQVKEAKH